MIGKDEKHKRWSEERGFKEGWGKKILGGRGELLKKFYVPRRKPFTSGVPFWGGGNQRRTNFLVGERQQKKKGKREKGKKRKRNICGEKKDPTWKGGGALNLLD